MKKQKRQDLNIMLYVTIAMLALVCVFSGTLAYYTASGYTSSSTGTYDLEAYFAYQIVGSSSVVTKSSSTLTIYPSAASLTRGTNFTLLAEDGTSAIRYLMFSLGSGSCSAYVKFWVNAYIVVDGVEQTDVDYGQYFTIVGGSNTRNTANPNIYYVNSMLTTGSNIVFCTSMTLDTDAPNEMLGHDLNISISFYAVQSDNDAYKTVFADELAYLPSGWGSTSG